MTHKTILLAVLTGAWMAVAGPCEAATNEAVSNVFGDAVLARGKGFQILQSQVDEAMVGFNASLASQGQAIPPGKRAATEINLFERLLRVQLLLTKATDEDKAKSAKEGGERAEEYIKALKLSEAALKRYLIAQGMSMEKFRQQFVDESLFRIIIDREIRSKITIAPDVARKYFEEHPSEFDMPDRVRFSQILFLGIDPATRRELSPTAKAEKKKLAQSVMERLKAGADFNQIAKDLSDDPRARETGGIMPMLTRKDMAPEIETVAFTIATNKLSDIITSQTGFHIIKVQERLPSRKIPFEEVDAKLMENLSVMEAQKQLPDFLAKLKKELNVEILDPKFDTGK
jgi:parvulin-like peptidyl-prolyl isomerase